MIRNSAHKEGIKNKYKPDRSHCIKESMNEYLSFDFMMRGMYSVKRSSCSVSYYPTRPISKKCKNYWNMISTIGELTSCGGIRDRCCNKEPNESEY